VPLSGILPVAINTNLRIFDVALTACLQSHC
jgi:hypothetical protein